MTPLCWLFSRMLKMRRRRKGKLKCRKIQKLIQIQIQIQTQKSDSIEIWSVLFLSELLPPLLLSFKEICALVRIFFRSQLNFPLCLIAFVVLSTDRKYTYASSPHPSTVVKVNAVIHSLCDYTTMMLKFILTPKIRYSPMGKPSCTDVFYTLWKRSLSHTRVLPTGQ